MDQEVQKLGSKDGQAVFRELLGGEKFKNMPKLDTISSPATPKDFSSPHDWQQHETPKHDLHKDDDSRTTDAGSALTSLQMTLQKLEQDKLRHESLVEQVTDTGRLTNRKTGMSTRKQLADTVQGQEPGYIRKPFWQNVKEKPLIDTAPASSSGANSSSILPVDEDTIREFFEYYFQQKCRTGALDKNTFGKLCTDAMKGIVHGIEAARLGDELFAQYSDRGQMAEGGYYGALAALAEKVGGTVTRGENIIFKALLTAEEGPQEGSDRKPLQINTNTNTSSSNRENSSSGQVSSTNMKERNPITTNQHQSLNSSPSASSLMAAGGESRQGSRQGSRNPSRRPSREVQKQVPSPRQAMTRNSTQPLSRGASEDFSSSTPRRQMLNMAMGLQNSLDESTKPKRNTAPKQRVHKKQTFF